MRDDIEVTVEGRRVRLWCIGNELWADGFAPHLSSVVVRRTGTLYQADYGRGTAAWFDTPQEAVDAARRDANWNQPDRDRNQIKQMTLMGLKEAAE